MSNGIDSERCPMCPETFEAFDEDGHDGAIRQHGELARHMERAHGLDDDQQMHAIASGLAAELVPGDRQSFLDMEDVPEDAYEKTTGHKIWCTAGFNDQCQCGARPDMAAE